MSNTELYTKDTRVWIPDADKVWKAGCLTQNYEASSKSLKILIEDDQIEIDYDINSNEIPNPKLPPLRNPDILIGQNDLTALSYLNEPEVLYNLEVRFLTSNQIYTYCGIVLVAINPYESLPIYGNEIIQAYYGQDVQNMDPHIFSVSEAAFQKMIQFDQNQSIIVSGESGAGKTVSAKYAMRYFANVGGSSEETQVEKKVLASNPIMEAFGNAKTTRNDNSSRFGKFIQIDFNRSHHIVGASMKTYLLEKSRVVFQADNERNYHIFYQLCSQWNNKDYEFLRLAPAKQFTYTNQGDAETIDNVNDTDVFLETLDAFKLLGIVKKDQVVIFSLISAILHLGNVKISSEKSGESSFVVKNDQSISIMCDLLKINENHMKAWLCNKRIKTVNEVVNTPLTLNQALFSRDALAKHMYSQLFNWVVSQINKCLKSSVKTHSFIGVLDIYGFETFKVNSFEQFCINYANEKLQQQFCQHVFKLEQEEYVREQIKWSFIDFYDNQPCIELIEGKIGILDLLDEECKMPKGSDITWCNKLYDKHLAKSNNSTLRNHFSKPRMSQSAFIVHHFAENVEYQVDGFLEKNRDTVLEEQLKVLKNSEIDFVSELFCEESDQSKPQGYEVKRNTMPAPTKTQMIRKKTVGSQFRESLNNLMGALNSTTPHYVRCIKPNDLKAPFKFEAKRAVEQLRACGVLETVRISAAGYPSRWTYQEFFQRYRMLFSSLSNLDRTNLKQTCEKILVSLIKDETKYQFGKSKIFFQAGQVAYLEKRRSEKLRSAGIMIQKHIRSWLAKSKYIRIKRSALLIQCQARGVLARLLLKTKRQTRAALLIQSKWRAYIARKKFVHLKNYIIRVQSLCRGYLARKNKQLMILNLKATKIQSYIRCWLARVRYKKMMRGIVLLQAHFRRRKARKLFKTLKIEARSVEHQKQLNKGLENKIISLQQQIEKINKERDQLSHRAAELEPLRAQLVSLRQSSTQAKETNVKLGELNQELDHLKQLYEKVKGERDVLAKEKNDLEKKFKDMSAKSNDEIKQLKLKADESDNKVVGLQIKLDQMKAQLIDLENERANHQKLINQYSKLEQRFDKVRSDLIKLSNRNQSSSVMSTNLLESNNNSTNTNTNTELLESLIEQLEQDSDNNQHLNSTNAQQIDGQEHEQELELELDRRENKCDNSLSLINKLQRRIATLELERKQAKMCTEHVDTHDNDLSSISIERLQTEKDHETIRCQELEFENQKLRDDLTRLRDLIADNEDNLIIPTTTAATAASATATASTTSTTGKTNANMDRDNEYSYLSTNNSIQSLINKELMNQFDVLNEEVQRRRDECVQLKSLLVANYRKYTTNQTIHSLHPFNNDSNNNKDSDGNALNEILINGMSQIDTNGTNEYEIAYNTQKVLNRILENQLTDLTRKHELNEQKYLSDLKKLRADNQRLDELLMKNLPNDQLIDAALRNQILRLSEINLDLSEKCDKDLDELKKYKKMLKIYIKRTRTMTLGLAINTNSNGSANSQSHDQQTFNSSTNQLPNRFGSIRANHIDLFSSMNTSASASSIVHMPHINKTKNTVEYLGILEWRIEDEPKIILKLVDELKPRLAITFLPGLPAYILFMCVRYADMSNDDDKVRLLLSSAVQSVKRLINRKKEDLEYLVLWLANFCRLLHNLKQYSGEEAFQKNNTQKQNEHCLKNFDLTEYRGIFSDLSIWLFQGIAKDLEKKINPYIVGAMLEHDALSISNDVQLKSTFSSSSSTSPAATSTSTSIATTNTTTATATTTQTTNSSESNNSNNGKQRYTMEALIKKLSEFLNILNSYCVDPEIVKQIFKQLYYFIGAATFNHLILRKEACNWSRGVDLRYKATLLEQWLRDSKLQDSGARQMLDPIVQASQLLQARKTDSDIQAICEMCPNLTIGQIQRILFMYTPAETYEQKLSRQFIDNVTNRLKALRKDNLQTKEQKLIIDTQYQIPICIPFNPSSIGLETIEIPQALDLGAYLRKI